MGITVVRGREAEGACSSSRGPTVKLSEGQCLSLQVAALVKAKRVKLVPSSRGSAGGLRAAPSPTRASKDQLLAAMPRVWPCCCCPSDRWQTRKRAYSSNIVRAFMVCYACGRVLTATTICQHRRRERSTPKHDQTRDARPSRLPTLASLLGPIAVVRVRPTSLRTIDGQSQLTRQRYSSRASSLLDSFLCSSTARKSSRCSMSSSSSSSSRQELYQPSHSTKSTPTSPSGSPRFPDTPNQAKSPALVTNRAQTPALEPTKTVSVLQAGISNALAFLARPACQPYPGIFYRASQRSSTVGCTRASAD